MIQITQSVNCRNVICREVSNLALASERAKQNVVVFFFLRDTLRMKIEQNCEYLLSFFRIMCLSRNARPICRTLYAI